MHNNYTKYLEICRKNFTQSIAYLRTQLLNDDETKIIEELYTFGTVRVIREMNKKIIRKP